MDASDKTPHSIQLNGVDIDWQLDQGTFQFFSINSAMFWINPSLLSMLSPLAQEMGPALFRLHVAHSASLGTEEDYQNMVVVLAEDFITGFDRWGDAVAAAGWGKFEVQRYEPEQQAARVKVSNTWELLMQKNQPERWGCPFIQGKIIGIFSQALGVNCWADEAILDYDAAEPFVEFEIYRSDKTIEQEIQQLREQRMRDRERFLAQEVAKKTLELKTAKFRAETANYAKSKLVNSLSHELRTPLNSVLGFSRQMQRLITKGQYEAVAEYAQKIHTAGDNVSRLVNNILTYSEVLDTDIIEMVEVDLQATIAEAIASVASLATARDICIRWLQHSETPVWILGYKPYVFEVFQALLFNAVKYIPSGGCVCLKLAQQAGQVTASVADNGQGIPESVRVKMFDAFERLSYQGSGVSGAGIGLTLVRMMMDKMDGTIEYRSSDFGGAEFELRFLPAGHV